MALLDPAATKEAALSTGVAPAEWRRLVQDFLGRLPKLPPSPLMRTGLVILAGFTVVALIGPLLMPGDPNTFSYDMLQPPSIHHWLGTTQTGQDVLRQLVVGTRQTMLVGFSAGLIATLISVVIGMLSGYLGGWVDEGLSLLTNVFLVLPGPPLAIVLSSYTQTKSIVPVIAIIAATGWAWGARVLRSQALTLRNRDFVQAAKIGGEGTFRIVFFEILPNLVTIVASTFIFTTIYAILTEIGLEYIGLGDVFSTSWGTMIFWWQNADVYSAWWWFLPPGICIALLGTALAFVNYGLDAIANPLLRAVAVKKVKRVGVQHGQ